MQTKKKEALFLCFLWVLFCMHFNRRFCFLTPKTTFLCNSYNNKDNTLNMLVVLVERFISSWGLLVGRGAGGRSWLLSKGMVQ